MPYISQEDRNHIDNQLQLFSIRETYDVLDIDFIASILKNIPSGKVKGAFNYFVSRLFLQTFKPSGYTATSDALRVFTDMDFELTRRLMNELEDRAIEKNGDLPELVNNVEQIKEEKYYYKLVSVINDKYYSFNYAKDDINTSSFIVEYKIGIETKPKLKGSKLFIFDTLENALLFKNKHYSCNSKIFKCKAINVNRMYCMSGSYYGVIDFWTDGEYSKVEPPTGTLSCDSLILIDEIELGKNNG